MLRHMAPHMASPSHSTTNGEPSPLDTEWRFFLDLMANGEGSPLGNESSAELSSYQVAPSPLDKQRRGLAVILRLMIRRACNRGQLASFLSVS